MGRPVAPTPTTLHAAPRAGARRVRHAVWGSLGQLLFLLPILAVVGVFIVLPTVSAVPFSLTDWNPGYPSPFVGLHNYIRLATSPIFHQILFNQLFLLLGLPLWVLAPLVLATMLYERVPAAALFRTVFFFPATVSPTLVGILFGFLLSPDGPLNALLRSVGLGVLAANWLSNVALVRPVLIGVLSWATIGTGVVIFSAALSTVPPELFEVAKLDGAGWWQRFRYVVVPGLASVIELWIVILIISVFVSMFPWIFTLTRGGPGYASTTIDFDIYQNALSFGYFGIAAAETVYLLAIVVVVVAVGGLAFRQRRG